MKFTSAEYRSAFQNKFGMPQGALRGVVGSSFATNNTNSGTHVVDEFGDNIKKATCTRGGTTQALHNGFLTLVTDMLKYSGIDVKGGKDTFGVYVNARVPLDNPANQRWKQGIIPDAVIQGRSLPALEGPGAERFGGKTTLLDVKTLSPCDNYKARLPASPESPFAAVVRKRESKVNKDYHRHARELDAKVFGTLPGAVGPIEKELNTYGKVVGLVLGAFGEFSETVHDLADLIATKQAAEYSLSHTMKPSHAKSMFKQRLYRLWGLYAHRGWANLLFQRCRILLKHHR